MGVRTGDNVYATVPDPKLDFVDTIVGPSITELCNHTSKEASVECVAYDLYKGLCDNVKMEDRILPQCLSTTGIEACTREEYGIHLEHLRKEAQCESEQNKAESGSDAQ